MAAYNPTGEGVLYKPLEMTDYKEPQYVVRPNQPSLRNQIGTRWTQGTLQYGDGTGLIMDTEDPIHGSCPHDGALTQPYNPCQDTVAGLVGGGQCGVTTLAKISSGGRIMPITTLADAHQADLGAAAADVGAAYLYPWAMQVYDAYPRLYPGGLRRYYAKRNPAVARAEIAAVVKPMVAGERPW
jgi:hypothetical protein